MMDLSPMHRHRYSVVWWLMQVMRGLALLVMILGVIAWVSMLKPARSVNTSSSDPVEQLRQVETAYAVLEAQQGDRRMVVSLFAGGLLTVVLTTLVIAVLDMSSCIQEDSRIAAMYRKRE
jgi:hypothetical protein